jgi:flagellar protein FliO/FliZ
VIPFFVAQTDVLTTAGPDLVPPIIRMTAGFLVVLAILAVLAWFMRKSLNARRTTGSMTVETALSLGERRSIVIVTVENRRLLLGLAPGQVSLVTELQPPSFGQAMAKATGEQVKR